MSDALDDDALLDDAPAPAAPHCSDAELNDWLDARLDAVAGARVVHHCAACAGCAARRDALAAVVAAARAAPDVVAPPDPEAILRAVAARVGGAPWASVPSPAARVDGPVRVPMRRRAAWALRAAAVVTVAALGALGTAWWARRDEPAGAAGLVAAGTPASTRPVAPARAAAPDETARALAELRAAAAGGDRVLAAAALASLEPSLATVDAAIAEAEAALARDPANAALADVVARAHERRRELVRQGAFLGSRA